MKTRRTALLLCALLLCLGAPSLTALEIGALFRLENLKFDSDRSKSDDSFSGEDFMWGMSVFATHTLSDKFSLEGGFYNDTILRNISYTLFNYDAQYISLGLGPFFGFFNSTSTLLKSGLSTSVRLDLPGIFYLLFRSDNSFGGRLVEDGDYIQERNDISLGFYLPNVIASLNLLTKKFTQKLTDYEVGDSLTDYALKIDTFQKNRPYRVLIAFSYQTLAKKFFELSNTTTHTLNSIVLGTEVDFAVNQYLKLLFDLESSIYTFGQDELLGISNPGPGGYLFRLNVGFQLNIDYLPKRRPQAPPSPKAVHEP